MSKEKEPNPIVKLFGFIGMVVGGGYGALIGANADDYAAQLIVFFVCAFGGAALGTLVGNVVFRLIIIALLIIQFMFRQAFIDVFREFLSAAFS